MSQVTSNDKQKYRNWLSEAFLNYHATCWYLELTAYCNSIKRKMNVDAYTFGSLTVEEAFIQRFGRDNYPFFIKFIRNGGMDNVSQTTEVLSLIEDEDKPEVTEVSRVLLVSNKNNPKVPPKDLAPLAVNAVPPEDFSVASSAVNAVPPKDLAPLVVNAVPPEDFSVASSAVNAVPPKDLAPLAVNVVPPEDLASSVVNAVPPEDLAPSAVNVVPPEDLAPSAVNVVPPEDLAPLAVNVVPPEDFSVASSAVNVVPPVLNPKKRGRPIGKGENKKSKMEGNQNKEEEDNQNKPVMRRRITRSMTKSMVGGSNGQS